MLALRHRHFQKTASNKIISYHLTDFKNTNTWQMYAKQTHPINHSQRVIFKLQTITNYNGKLCIVTFFTILPLTLWCYYKFGV